MAKKGANSIAVVDVGSTKMCCLIAQLDSDGDARITGAGHLGAAGMALGTVNDLDRAENTLSRVVQQAEVMAGHRVDQVVLVNSGGHREGEILRVEVSVSGHAVERADVAKALRLAEREIQRPDATVLHALPACFSVDNHLGVRRPEGLLGERLSLDVNVISCDHSHLGNIEALASQAMLDVPAVVSGGYAAGLACLHDEEKEIGVACADLGGGITSTTIFCGGQMVFGATDPLGSDQITRDLARRLSLPLAEADRLKKSHGRVWECDADHKEVVSITQLDQEGGLAQVDVRRSRLIGLIRPRVEEILTAVSEQLKRAGFTGRDAGTVVLTGGGAQLQGIHQLAEQIIGCPVRFGFPQRLQGLPTQMRGQAFAGAVGGVLYAMDARKPELAELSRQAQRGAFANSMTHPMWPRKVMRWLRANW